METLPYKKALIKDIESTFGQLYKALSAFDDDAFNKVPFERSWTAGQVTEHIIKSTGGIPDEHTRPVNRPYDEKVVPIKAMFLNFNIKFEADSFLAPGKPPHDKTALLETLKEIEAMHKATANTADLKALCLDMELPTFGYLTRYEWLRFILVHTQRHTRQIENIRQSKK